MSPYYPPCYALVSGGKDSLSTAQVLANADRLLGCVALDTGISTPDWHDFMVTTCRARSWPLMFCRTTSGYEELVHKFGFPGPGGHQKFMSYLKGRAVRVFHRQYPDAILASGTRRNESNRRLFNTKPISFWEGVPILTPIYDWTTEQTWDFFWKQGFQRAPAYQLLMISGDCLCGAFAQAGEAAALYLAYPQVATQLVLLGERIKDKFPTRCHWGWGCKQVRKGKTAKEFIFCQECDDAADIGGDA